MKKVKVYELAKEIGISSKELIQRLSGIGITVKGYQSYLDEESYKKAIRELKKEKKEPKKEAVKEKKAEKKKQEIKEAKQELKLDKEAKKLTKEEAKPVVKVFEGISVKDFAEKINRSPSEVIKNLISLGEMTAINEPVSTEAMKIIGEEFGVKIEILGLPELLEEEEIVDREEDLESRPPVVTVMGHVDHGKTKLLDAIRETNVVEEETGGITQHIGAYQVEYKEKKITFIDTPGHESFTAMRARGARVTDIAVLVVAADDGVMAQTIEAIDHARAANVPIIVAINKIDKPEANPDKVKNQLLEYKLIPEEWGGDTVFVKISAKYKTNIDDLLEMILLVADLKNLKANKNCPASGVVIEAWVERGRGPVATTLIHRGTLKVGETVIAGLSSGKVRAIFDDKGRKIAEGLPSQPVEIIGLSQTPQAGDILKIIEDERLARRIIEERMIAQKAKSVAELKREKITLDNLFEKIKEGEVQELKVIVKADVQGSVEALCDSFEKINLDTVRINVIHKGVGGINETDIMLASASNAIVIGFNVVPDAKSKEMAEKEDVDIRIYDVVYKAIEDIEKAAKGLLVPEIKEITLGELEVREVFKITKVGTIAGSFVRNGVIRQDSMVKVIRDGVVIYNGKIRSLKRFKGFASEVKEGLECGVGIEDFNDIKARDILEVYQLKEEKIE